MAALNNNKPIALIMAGGSGTRFWPLSTPENPKQFLTLIDDQSLLQLTLGRTRSLTPMENIAVCGLKDHKKLLEQQLPEINRWIFEPEGRNTAACNLLSVIELQRAGVPEETVIVVLPADHHIKDTGRLTSLLEKAVGFAKDTRGLVTLGIKPMSPHTGYGYIVNGNTTSTEGVFEVDKFVEKPKLEKAKTMLAAGNCFWNSGIFVWQLGAILEAFKAYAPEMTEKLLGATSEAETRLAYQSLESTPIDTAILEKADNVYVIPADIAWSDLGSWNALYQLYQTKSLDNVALGGKVKSIDSKGCIVHTPSDFEVGLIGVNDLAVVISDGKVLITRREDDQKVKKLVQKLK